MYVQAFFYYVKLDSKKYVNLGKWNRPVSVVAEFTINLIKLEDAYHCCGQTVIAEEADSFSAWIVEFSMCHS